MTIGDDDDGQTDFHASSERLGVGKKRLPILPYTLLTTKSRLTWSRGVLKR